MTLNIAVCDDDNNWINNIESHLLRYRKTYKELEWNVFYSGEELLKYYSMYGNVFDMLITDIEMNEINGVETANKIRELDKNVTIIFLTNHEKYMRDCFKCTPSGFLNKPVSYEELKDLLDREIVDSQNSSRFSFKYNRKEYTIPFDNIIYVNNDMRKVVLHTVDGTYEFMGKLKDYKNVFEAHGFAMTHNSFCVNLSAITKRSTVEIILNNGETVPVSDSRRVEFENIYLNYIMKKR